MTGEDIPPGVDAALTRLQASVDRGFGDLRMEITGVRGSLDLLTHRASQQDARDEAHERRAGELDARMRTVEASAVTREEMERQHRRTLGWVSLIVTVLGIVVAPGASLVIALLT